MRAFLMASAAVIALAGPALAQSVTTSPLPAPDAAASSTTTTVNPDGSTTKTSEETVVQPTRSGTVTTTTETTSTTPPAPPASVVTANTPAPATPQIDPSISSLNASRLIGEDVYDTQGEEVGEIADILFNQKGQITAALVSVADTGFWGFGERQVTVDLAQLRMHDERIVISSFSHDQLKSMPEYKQSTEWKRVDRDAPVGSR